MGALHLSFGATITEISIFQTICLLSMGREFKTAHYGTPLHGNGSVKSTVLIHENPQFMWAACDFIILGYKLAIFGHLSSIFLISKNNNK